MKPLLTLLFLPIFAFSQQTINGSIIHDNGDKYVEQWKDDQRHGQGTSTYASGTVKEGLWENDEFIGE